MQGPPCTATTVRPLSLTSLLTVVSLADRLLLISRHSCRVRCSVSNASNTVCNTEVQCSRCSGRHATCLHCDNGSHNQQDTSAPQPAPEQAVSFKIESQLRQHCTTMPMPVFASSSEDPAKEVLTYALIDSQSDKSYILQEISDSLFTARGRSQLKVSTISSRDQLQWSDHLLNLHIRGFSSPHVVTVKHLYSLKDIPANSEHIPTPQTAAGWPRLQYLAEKFTPLQGCKVGMIIGFPCSKASLPMEIVQCESHLTLPYAVRTILGWAIIGGQESLQIDPVVHQIHTLDSTTEYVPEESQENLSVSYSRIQTNPKLLGIMDSSNTQDPTRRLPADSPCTAISEYEFLRDFRNCPLLLYSRLLYYSIQALCDVY